MRIARAMTTAMCLTFLTSSEAWGQEAAIPGAPTEVPPPATDAPPPAAPVAPAPAAAPVAPPAAKGHVSLALERIGGVGSGTISFDKTSSHSSVFVLGIGGERADPNSVPRVGVDYVFPGGFSIGAAFGFSEVDSSSVPGKDGPSIIYFTAVGRVGYRLALAEWADLTPRIGVSGASASTHQGSSSVTGSFVGGELEAPLAFRLTPSFNLLVAPEMMVARTAGDASPGTFFSLQAWLGVGGYL